MLFIINPCDTLHNREIELYRLELSLSENYYILDTSDLSVEEVSYQELDSRIQHGVKITNVEDANYRLLVRDNAIPFYTYARFKSDSDIQCLGGRLLYGKSLCLDGRDLGLLFRVEKGVLSIYYGGRLVYTCNITAKTIAEAGVAYIYKVGNYIALRIVVTLVLSDDCVAPVFIIDMNGNLVDVVEMNNRYSTSRKYIESADIAFITKYKTFIERRY